jgi:hypothetical protein
VIKAASELKDKTTAINQLWQADFTYLKIIACQVIAGAGSISALSISWQWFNETLLRNTLAREIFDAITIAEVAAPTSTIFQSLALSPETPPASPLRSTCCQFLIRTAIRF